MTFVLILALLTATSEVPVPSSDLRQGDRVRVTAPGAGLRGVVGTLHEVTGRSVAFWPLQEREAVEVPRDQIDQLELFDGMKGRGELFATSSVAGLGIGILSGALLGALSGDDNCDPSSLCFDRTETAIILGIVGGGAGLIVGMIVGVARPDKEVWAPVELVWVPTRDGEAGAPMMTLSRSF